MQLTLTSPTLPMSQLDDFAETLVMPRMSMVSGVAQVNVQGSQKYAVRVQVDPDKLVSKRIGLNEVDTAIANCESQSSDRHAIWTRSRAIRSPPTRN